MTPLPSIESTVARLRLGAGLESNRAVRATRSRLTRLSRSRRWTRCGQLVLLAYAVVLVIALDLVQRPPDAATAAVCGGLVLAAGLLAWQLRSVGRQINETERVLEMLEGDVLAQYGVAHHDGRGLEWWDLVEELDLPQFSPREVDLAIEALRARRRRLDGPDSAASRAPISVEGSTASLPAAEIPSVPDVASVPVAQSNAVAPPEPGEELNGTNPGQAPIQGIDRRAGSPRPTPVSDVDLVVVVDGGLSAGQRMALRDVVGRLASVVPVLVLASNSLLWKAPSRRPQ
jgi:hypothetical protein